MAQNKDPDNPKSCANDCERLVDTLFAMDRLSRMGKLVPGLVHNLNGPLQNLSMLVELLIRGQERMHQFGLDRDPSLTNEWEAIHAKQLHRMQLLNQQISVLNEILRDILTLQEIEKDDAELDLRLVVDKLVKVFRADLFLKHQVDVSVELAEDLSLIRIPGTELIASLFHLFQNAIAAVRRSPEKKIVIEGRPEGDRVLIIFRDSGCGFENSAREALFELFDTRWPKVSEDHEEHFGLGLFAVRRLLAPYGAQVRLERHEGETWTILEIPA